MTGPLTTTFDGRPVEKPFAWSWSALESFETCAKKHYHSKVRKDYPEPVSQPQKWGLQVHQSMADRISKAKPLPKEMPYEKWIDYVMENSDRTQVSVKVEQRLAITEDIRPCDYFDKNVDPWFRTVADVLKLRGEFGRLVDWKTGHYKEGSDQLLLCATAAMVHYPALDYVLCEFIWLQDDLKTEQLFSRADMPQLWSRVLPRVDELELAHKTGVWPMKPSGLCKKHCSVTTCPYHGKGSY